jgi:hypothetical protein
MAEKDGYKTLDLVIEELGYPENRIRVAIAALDIQARTFPADRRHRYYSHEDIKRIKDWIERN